MIDILAPYIAMAMLVAFVIFAWFMSDDNDTKSSKAKHKKTKD